MPVTLAAFEAKIDRRGEHDLWIGSTDSGGTGQIRIDGKLRTAAQVSWELAYGDIPAGHRVYSCPDVKLCIRADHLRLRKYGAKDDSSGRGRRGAGSIRPLGEDRWKLTVDAGRDESGRRRRLTRTVRGTKAQATKALAAFTVEVQSGERRPRKIGDAITVADLVEWYVTFAREVRGLERTTVFGYQEVFDTWLKDRIGHIDVERLTPAQIDDAFGHMRSNGMSHSRMNNARAALSGAYKWGRRHDKVRTNPMRGFELPKSKYVARKTIAPELDEVLRLLSGADEHDPEIAPVLKLAATTGLRRGELCGLRRSHLRLDRGELSVERAISEIKSVVEDKPTKNNDTRTIKLDDATIGFLQSHLADMDARAESCGVTVAADGYLFSLEPDCAVPMRPDLMTKRTARLRKLLGITSADFSATILAMRKWTSTELMDAGFNPAAVSGRQGHTVQVMLNNYSSRRASADQAAADHLGSRVHRTEG